MKNLLFCLILLVASPAFAEMYIGSVFGGYDYEEDFSLFFTTDKAEINGRAAGLQVGFAFNRWIGIEATYSSYFEGDDSIQACCVAGGFFPLQIEIEGSAWGLFLRPSFPVSDNTEMFIKLGYAFWDIDTTLASPSAFASGTGNGEDFAWALGMRYHATDDWSIGGEVGGIEVVSNLLTYTASVSFHF